MLDYYGSIIKKKPEIIKELIDHYKKYDAGEITEIIEFLMKNNEILHEYSVSGWMVFFYHECVQKINKEIELKELKYN